MNFAEEPLDLATVDRQNLNHQFGKVETTEESWDFSINRIIAHHHEKHIQLPIKFAAYH